MIFLVNCLTCNLEPEYAYHVAHIGDTGLASRVQNGISRLQRFFYAQRSTLHFMSGWAGIRKDGRYVLPVRQPDQSGSMQASWFRVYYLIRNTVMSISTSVTSFSFIKAPIRTVLDAHNAPWFCAKDICAALEINWNGETLVNLPDEYQSMWNFHIPKNNKGSGGGQQEMITVNEAGLYFLTFRSHKPKAKEFAYWVCSEVLPTLRKKGHYGNLDIKGQLSVTKRIIDLSKLLSECESSFVANTILDQLQQFHSLAGSTMPDLGVIKHNLSQLDWVQGGAA